ncbi:hypothetical protein ABKV19_000713 [Rosa sericea]
MDSDSEDSTVNLFPKTLKIKVLWGGARIPLDIPVTASIEKVKQMISEEAFIPIAPNRQQLNWDGMSLSDDEITVEDYGIPEDATLHVINKIKVSIRTDTTRYEVVVPENITVGDLKNKVPSGVDDIENRVLRIHGSRVVLDERAVLWASGIHEGAVLQLSD